MTEIIVAWFALSILAGIIAENKGRSRVGFIFLSLLLSPVVGIIAALVAKPNKAQLENDEIESGAAKRCPVCAELVRADALKCRFCGSDIWKHETLVSEPKVRVSETASYKFGTRLGRLFRWRARP